jgi:hypothetical protein
LDQRLLDRSGSPEKAGRNAVDLSRPTTELRPGTILGREWNGQMQQVAVLTDGFAWNGNTYPSLSKAAFAITAKGCDLIVMASHAWPRPTSERVSHFFGALFGGSTPPSCSYHMSSQFT